MINYKAEQSSSLSNCDSMKRNLSEMEKAMKLKLRIEIVR